MSNSNLQENMRRTLQGGLDDYRRDRKHEAAERQVAQLKLIVSALQAQARDLDTSKKQAEEMAATLLNEKLTPAELGEHVFSNLVGYMAKKELTRSQTYAAVIQNTILALDQAIQSTCDADTKASLIEVVKNLHITVKA